MDDARGAAVVYQRLLARSQHWADLDPKNTFWQRNLAISHGKVAQAQAALGDLPAAIAGLRHAIRRARGRTIAAPQVHVAEADLGLGEVAGEVGAVRAGDQQRVDQRGGVAEAGDRRGPVGAVISARARRRARGTRGSRTYGAIARAAPRGTRRGHRARRAPARRAAPARTA